MDLDNKVIDFIEVTHDDDGFFTIKGVVAVSISDNYIIIGSSLSEKTGYREIVIPFVNLKRVEMIYKNKDDLKV